MSAQRDNSQLVKITVGSVIINGDLTVPREAKGMVLFAHGSGSSRHSSRNRFVAGELNTSGMATLLIDLLTDKESRVDARTREFRFNIPMLAERITGATAWLLNNSETSDFKIGYFGSSTGAAAALISAAETQDDVKTVVSRGGRVDLAESVFSDISVPVLMIVGGNDPHIMPLNREALHHLPQDSKLEVVKGATHLFEEPGAMEKVAEKSARWFSQYIK